MDKKIILYFISYFCFLDEGTAVMPWQLLSPAELFCISTDYT